MSNTNYHELRRYSLKSRELYYRSLGRTVLIDQKVIAEYIKHFTMSSTCANTQARCLHRLPERVTQLQPLFFLGGMEQCHIDVLADDLEFDRKSIAI